MYANNRRRNYNHFGPLPIAIGARFLFCTHFRTSVHPRSVSLAKLQTQDMLLRMWQTRVFSLFYTPSGTQVGTHKYHIKSMSISQWTIHITILRIKRLFNLIGDPFTIYDLQLHICPHLWSSFTITNIIMLKLLMLEPISWMIPRSRRCPHWPYLPYDNFNIEKTWITLCNELW